ncbi:MAG TPA: branched-chain amino acid transaminase [Anaerolineaceae bacterium]|nr:branched-chain amino acid transaminase [Anaerolineaceae bacterium]
MSKPTQFIWMNGELIDADKATIPFLNTALHYGVAVFEGIRCYQTPSGSAVFRLQEHIERLLDSAQILGFRSMPYTTDELIDAVNQVITANGFTQCYVRPLIFAGGPQTSLNLDDCPASVGITAWEWGAYLGEEAIEKGIRANVSSFTRHQPNVMMTKAKISGNYANSILAKTESARLGFDEAIMLDPQGYVAECTGENIFLVRKGNIYTTPTAAILEGITRDALLTICQDLGYEVIEQPVSRDQLYIADEVFVSGTAAEVVAVREIDFRQIGNGKMGPVTRKIQQAFQETIHGNGKHSAEWLYPVKVASPASVR